MLYGKDKAGPLYIGNGFELFGVPIPTFGSGGICGSPCGICPRRLTEAAAAVSQNLLCLVKDAYEVKD